MDNTKKKVKTIYNLEIQELPERFKKRDTNVNRDLRHYQLARESEEVLRYENVEVCFQNAFGAPVEKVYRAVVYEDGERYLLALIPEGTATTFEYWVDSLASIESLFEGAEEKETVVVEEEAETTERETCKYPKCGRPAHMAADAGPACAKHYDDLC